MLLVVKIAAGIILAIIIISLLFQVKVTVKSGGDNPAVPALLAR